MQNETLGEKNSNLESAKVNKALDKDTKSITDNLDMGSILEAVNSFWDFFLINLIVFWILYLIYQMIFLI